MKKLIFIVISLALLLSACSGIKPSNTTPASIAPAVNNSEGHRATLKQQPIQPVNADFVSGINSFGFKSAGLLYNTDENLALSPVSLELALAMTRTGASGVTAEEMAAALGLEGIADEDIVSACRSLMWRSNTGGMEAANSLWLAEGEHFSEEFLRGCADDFMSDAFPLVIPGAMDDINAWADEKTHGRINDIIKKELSPDIALVLCNALYYLGDWEQPFEANDTYDEEFASPGGPVAVPFMHSERGAAYFKSDDFSMLSLPFKSEEGEGKYAMAFLLPKEGEGLGDMLSSINSESFSEALGGLKEQQVRIKLPKFEYSFFTSFKDTLMSLGMNAAFGPADFSKMTDSPNNLFIDDVLHKCYIRVDELGAEAAAVTAVTMARGAAMPPENIAEFFADRPFLFAIYSEEDGAIAFMGAVNDPSQE
jgi:serpin B